MDISQESWDSLEIKDSIVITTYAYSFCLLQMLKITKWKWFFKDQQCADASKHQKEPIKSWLLRIICPLCASCSFLITRKLSVSQRHPSVVVFLPSFVFCVTRPRWFYHIWQHFTLGEFFIFLSTRYPGHELLQIIIYFQGFLNFMYIQLLLEILLVCGFMYNGCYRISRTRAYFLRF